MVVLMHPILRVACVLAVAAGAMASRPAAQAPVAPKTQTVDVAAERFSFSPSEIKTTVGTTLTVRLTSDDTVHGFRIVGTNVNLEIPKRNRGVATATFTPDKPGRYTFECSQLCGAGHSFMRGVIIVTEDRAGDRR
jgi:cytochrome c oxidase subunit II